LINLLICGAISDIDKNTIGQAVRNEDSHISINIAAGALCKKVIAPDTINAVPKDINKAKINLSYLFGSFFIIFLYSIHYSLTKITSVIFSGLSIKEKCPVFLMVI
jgi:VIT1/CCC1 family predicted Fe2+/Mn2+ transporter